MRSSVCPRIRLIYVTEVHSEPSQTSKMELFVKILNSLQPLTIFARAPIFDVRVDFEYVWVNILNRKNVCSNVFHAVLKNKAMHVNQVFIGKSCRVLILHNKKSLQHDKSKIFLINFVTTNFRYVNYYQLRSDLFSKKKIPTIQDFNKQNLEKKDVERSEFKVY